MRTAILIFATLIVGAVISTMLSGCRKKLWVKILNIPVSVAVTAFAFLGGVYVYAKLAKLIIAAETLFPDRGSKLIGSYLYLVTAVIVGFLLGAAESGGLERYAKALLSSRYSKGAAAVLLAANVLFLAAGVASVYTARGEGLRISEVCPHNFNLAADIEGNFSDYVELYNAGESPVNLAGYFLSDDKEDLQKFKLPDMTLAAGEYALVWADGLARAADNTEIHANFRLSDGETLWLTDQRGRSVDAVELGTLPDNVSVTNLGGVYVEAYGTPGVSNENCRLYRAATLKTPEFDLESGFYTADSITLTVTAPLGVTVYYTTDGSIPNTDSLEYTQPLVLTDVSGRANRYVNVKNTVANYDNHAVKEDPVDKATVIRAIAVDQNGAFSEVVTATYFVGEAARKYQGYAVLSIVSDPDGLFGEQGICVTGAAYDEWYNNTDRSGEAPVTNFDQHGKMWEREAAVQYWDQNGTLVLDQLCGIRVQGNSYRGQATKRFSFYAREHYNGNDLFEASVFPSGQMSHSFYTRSDVADMIAQDLIKDRELAMQEGVAVICFLDGEFYCETFIRERHDSTYFAEHYGVAEDDLVVITSGELDEGTEEDLMEYQEFLAFATHADMTDPENYAEFEARMDVQNFIDFMAANLYTNNLDVATNQNFKVWRSRSGGGEGYQDGRWRMASYDMDAISWAYHVRTDSTLAECDPFRYTLKYDEKYGADTRKLVNIAFFQNLLNNETFKTRFITTYLDMMNTNFSMDSYGGAVYAAYNDAQSSVWTTLLETRHSYAVEHLRYAFDLEGQACRVVLERTEGGAVSINGTHAYSAGTVWTGTYISGLEITVTAQTAEGWVFAGWEGDLVSRENTLAVDLTEQGVTLKAVFVPIGGDGNGN